MINPFETKKEVVNTSPIISDEIKKTTCYMCACRCGINVHLKDGKIRYIDGNKDHPTNKEFYVQKVLQELCNKTHQQNLESHY